MNTQILDFTGNYLSIKLSMLILDLFAERKQDWISLLFKFTFTLVLFDVNEEFPGFPQNLKVFSKTFWFNNLDPQILGLIGLWI